MANTVEARGVRPVRADLRDYSLRVSRYDRVASMLLALLVLVGTIVLTLVIIWLTNRIFARQVAVPVILEQIGDGGGSLGDSMEMEAPSLEETDLVQPKLTDTLEAIADVVAAQAAVLADPALYAEISQEGGGRGDHRAAGSGGGRPGRRRHWEIRFAEGNTLDGYARQLDYFKIELGVLRPGNQVEYAWNLVKSTPDRRTGAASEEKRYYLTWQDGDLVEADRELLAKAGSVAGDGLILKFLTPQLEAQLAQLERSHAGRQADHVRATYFDVVPRGQGYIFRVSSQSYN